MQSQKTAVKYDGSTLAGQQAIRAQRAQQCKELRATLAEPDSLDTLLAVVFNQDGAGSIVAMGPEEHIKMALMRLMIHIGGGEQPDDSDTDPEDALGDPTTQH